MTFLLITISPVWPSVLHGPSNLGNSQNRRLNIQRGGASEQRDRGDAASRSAPVDQGSRQGRGLGAKRVGMTVRNTRDAQPTGRVAGPPWPHRDRRPPDEPQRARSPAPTLR